MVTRPIDTNRIDPRFLLAAYRSGFFPMADARTGEIQWYSPDPRTIFELNTFHVPRSLRTSLRLQPFEITVDQNFEQVLRACADRSETWISESIVESYTALHTMGYAHSVETRARGKLVGGLYGVAIGGAFFGESMFSRVSQASKAALTALVARLRERGFKLLDTQYTTDHLAMFGAQEISREQYLQRLQSALTLECSFI